MPSGKTARAFGTGAAGWCRLSTLIALRQSRNQHSPSHHPQISCGPEQPTRVYRVVFQGMRCVMSKRLINGLVLILVLTLVVILFSSDRSISAVMEDCGKFIARLFN